jgi:hypothetical protein
MRFASCLQGPTNQLTEGLATQTASLPVAPSRRPIGHLRARQKSMCSRVFPCWHGMALRNGASLAMGMSNCGSRPAKLTSSATRSSYGLLDRKGRRRFLMLFWATIGRPLCSLTCARRQQIQRDVAISQGFAKGALKKNIHLFTCSFLARTSISEGLSAPR